MVKPRKKKYQQGSYRTSVGGSSVGKACTNLGKLPPVQKVTGIIFEDKDKVDLVLMPHSASKREEDDQKVDEEEASIYLSTLALRAP